MAFPTYSDSVDVAQLQAAIAEMIPYAHIEAGTVNVSVSGTPSTGQVNVTFSQPFSGNPVIIVSSGNWLYTVSWGSRTSSGFQISARRSTESSSSVTSVPVSWVALG